MNQPEMHPSELYAWAESWIGPFEVLANYRPNSVRTGVWKLRAYRDAKFFYIKTFSRKERWHPEVYAYQNWVPVLKPYVPEFIAAYKSGDCLAILITSIEGTIMREAELDSGAIEAAYRRAGELTNLLHRSQTGKWFGRPDMHGNPIELIPYVDPVQFVTDSIREMNAVCTENGLLEASEQELVQWALQHVQVFAGAKPVPISWDSTPGNWLVDDQGVLTGMIDFENMLWGIDVDSFSILFSRYFSGNPSAGRAFFQGYDPGVLQDRSTEIQICCIKMAIGDICWGTQHNAPEVVRYGRELLKKIYDHQLMSD